MFRICHLLILCLPFRVIVHVFLLLPFFYSLTSIPCLQVSRRTNVETDEPKDRTAVLLRSFTQSVNWSWPFKCRSNFTYRCQRMAHTKEILEIQTEGWEHLTHMILHVNWKWWFDEKFNCDKILVICTGWSKTCAPHREMLRDDLKVIWAEWVKLHSIQILFAKFGDL